MAERVPETTEEALREREGLFRNIFNYSNDAIFVIDPTRDKILDVNPRTCGMLGYSREELLSLPVSAIHPNEMPEMRAFAQSVFERGQGWTNELTCLTKAGQILSAEISASLTYVAGRPCIIALVRDITERRQLEERLRQAQKMEAVGQLAGGIAHDFNNLLQVVTGYSELLLARLVPGDPLREEIETIKKAGERAASLTRQLLAFGRRQVLAPKILDLNAIVSNMGQTLRGLIGENIDLVTAPRPGLRYVKADPDQIEQVILNLAANARDAMPRGGRLTIETEDANLDEACARQCPDARPGSYVMLAISDTGCGMDAETRARLFEPFFTTKAQGRGTGLGLAMVYGIVTQSGGWVSVSSEPGRGSTFRVYLPRVEEVVGAGQPARSRMEPSRDTMTILLVEDEEMVRSLVRAILQGNGYTVLEAASGAEALQVNAQREDPIHLMVTDVMMPHLNGRELAERLKPLRPDMKVLYMSGYTEDEVVRQGALETSAAFLQKPFAPNDLLRKVHETMDN